MYSVHMMRPADHTLPYRVYQVNPRHRSPLLDFILNALRASKCRPIQYSSPDHAPFRISFETSEGDRMGIVAYAFLANTKATRNRPSDEYRFQLKYGSKEARNVHDLWQDPFGVYTTILIGVSPSEQFFVGFDPVLHSPTKHYISLEFKKSFVEKVLAEGWAAQERERKRSEDPVEVIVGGRPEAFLEFVRFEREARGEDQGHRALLSERRGTILRPSEGLITDTRSGGKYVHQLSRELELSESEVLDLIAGTKRLKMAVRGWVAEEHLVRRLQLVPGITDCRRNDTDGSPDIQLRFEGSGLLLVECKNVLREPTRQGAPRVDFQRTRASKADPCSRYYSPEDFDVLAACLHARTERWDYSFTLTKQLDPHKKCLGKLASGVVVDSRWVADIRGILGEVARTR